MSDVRTSHAVACHGAAAPRSVGRWKLKTLLGTGQFGATWLAHDGLGQCAAVKLLAEPPGEEALALARVAHPGVPRLLDSGGYPQPFLAMEHVSGRPLKEAFPGQTRPLTAAYHLAGQLFDALSAVHRAGIVHGDIKPENMVISEDGHAKLTLLDFGMVGLRGGTRDYAAPERLQGGPNTPAGDVYAGGLVLFQLIHGHLPHHERSPNERLRARLEAAPPSTAGPEWSRSLLRQLLDPDPRARPTARHAVETLAAAGYQPPMPTRELLFRRLKVAEIPRGEADAARQRWERDGGVVVLRATPRAGGSHQLSTAATRLNAQGQPTLWIRPATRSWGAIEAALQAPTVPGSPRPLPDGIDPLERSERCVDALVSRGGPTLRILVDAYDDLDPGSRLVVQSLVRRGGVPVFIATRTSNPSAAPPVSLLPLDREQCRVLVGELLGQDGEIDALIDPLLQLTGGRPAAILDAVHHALDAQILIRPTWRWTLDASRIAELRHTPWSDGLPALSEGSRRVAGTLALFEDSLNIEDVARLSGLSPTQLDQAVGSLMGQGIVVLDGKRLRIASLALAQQLAAQHPDPPAAHRALYGLLQSDPDADRVRLTWHAAKGKLVQPTRDNGPEAMAMALARDGTTGVRLAAALHECEPTDASAEAYAHALHQDGQMDRAIALAESWLEGREPSAGQLGLRLVLTRALAADPERFDRAQSALAEAERCSPIPTPSTVDVVKAQLAFRRGRHARVLELTQALPSVLPEPRPLRGQALLLRLVRAQSLHATGRTAEALPLLELDPTGCTDLPEYALIQGVRGRLLWHAGHVRDAAAVLGAAAQLPVGAITRAQMANNAALALYDSGDIPGALDSWERAIGLFDRLDLRTDLVRALTNVVIGYKDAARWGRALEAGERAFSLACDQDLPHLAAMCKGNLGDVALARGQYDLARDLYDECASIAQAHDLTGELVEVGRRRAELAVLRGDPDASQRVDQALERAVAADVPGEARRARVLQALCAARRGDRHSANATLSEVLEVLRSQGAARELAEVRIWAAEAWLALGDDSRCIEELDRALAYADEAGLVGLRARGDAVRARVAPTAADPPETELEAFLMATAQLARHQDLSTLFAAAALAMRDLAGVERAFVLHECGDSIEIAAFSGPDEAAPAPPSNTVVSRALRTARPVVVTDLNEREDLREAESILALDLRFAACVPLRTAGRVVGALYVDGPLIVERGLQRISRVLTFLADHVAAALGNVRAHRAARQRADEISEVGHDLRGMLLVIEANVHDVLLDAMASEDRHQIRALQDVLLATDRVQRLSDGLIRRYHTRNQRIDLSGMVEECLSWSAADSRRRRVAIRPDLDGPIAVEGDPDELNRAIAHLVRNAIGHSEPGASIQVSVREEDGDAVLRLCNPDLHLAPSDLDGLFEAAGTTPGHHCVGVGLSVARRIARAHGGGVEVRDHAADGAEFMLRVRAA